MLDWSVRQDPDELSALFYPTGLRPSGVPLTIVCGPPASGKSSYVKARSKPEDVVIDLDLIAGGRHLVPAAIRMRPTLARVSEFLKTRNDMLASLHTMKRKGVRAWFIVGAPDAGERDNWASDLGASAVVLMLVPMAVCFRRIVADPAREHTREHMAEAVASWFSRYTPRAADKVVASDA